MAVVPNIRAPIEGNAFASCSGHNTGRNIVTALDSPVEYATDNARGQHTAIRGCDFQSKQSLGSTTRLNKIMTGLKLYKKHNV